MGMESLMYFIIYLCMNQYFSGIATLLDAADAPAMSDKMYRTARKRFTFHEVNGINLGFLESRWGGLAGALEYQIKF